GYRMRDRQVGMRGVDIHRCYVYLDLGRNFFQIEAADAAGCESHSSLELHRNPFRVLTHFHGESFGVDLNARPAAAHIRTKPELGAKVDARAQGIFWTGNVGV